MSATSSAKGADSVVSPADNSGHDKMLDVSAERVNSEAQIHHDPLCRNGLTDYEWAKITRHVAPEDCLYCTLIAKARADEREQAAQRVQAPHVHERYCNLSGEPPLSAFCDCGHDSCIAAARGEEQ